MAEPVFRQGAWWQQQDDGTWLRWNEAASSWERASSPPPDEGSSDLPPVPPMPGTSVPGQYRTPMGGAQVPNHLVWAILVTLFCFLPTGIVAIVYASQVNSKQSAGDYAGAVEASNKAKTWSIVSVVAGVVFGIIYVAAFAGSGGSQFS